MPSSVHPRSAARFPRSASKEASPRSSFPTMFADSTAGRPCSLVFGERSIMAHSSPRIA